jgi:hypothetical protein
VCASEENALSRRAMQIRQSILVCNWTPELRSKKANYENRPNSAPDFRIQLPNINNNNSIQFFIIYMPSQQPQGQLQVQHCVDTDNNNNKVQNKKHP